MAALCHVCIQELPVDRAAVAVVTGKGGWWLAHATDAAAATLENAGFALGDGPCLQALASHSPVLAGDLQRDGAARWPLYSRAAADAGCRAVFSFPLQLGAIVVGTLALYADRPAELADKQLSVALRMADAAAWTLLDPGQDNDFARYDPEQEQGWNRVEVYQASGMIMAQLNISILEAMARLRAYAFADSRDIAAVARDVVDRSLRFVPEPEAGDLS